MFYDGRKRPKPEGDLLLYTNYNNYNNYINLIWTGHNFLITHVHYTEEWE